MYTSVWFTDKRILIATDAQQFDYADYEDAFEIGLAAGEVHHEHCERPDVVIIGDYSNRRKEYEQRYPAALLIEERELDRYVEELEMQFVDIVNDVLAMVYY